MRTGNPFVPGVETEKLFGRKEEIWQFSAYLTERKPVKIAIIGAKGIGKTTLIKKFREMAEKDRLITAIYYTGYTGKKNQVTADNENAGMLFIEDVDKNPDVLENLEKLEKTNKTIVVSSTSEKWINKDIFQIMKLRPLNDFEIKEFVEEKLKDKGIKIAGGALEMIIEQTEGHPFVLLLVLWNLYDKLPENERIISKAHYIAALQSTLELLGHKFFDDLYFDCSDGERMVLKAVIKSSGGTPIEISEMIKKPLNTITTLLLRLVDKGNLVKISRGKYRIFNRLYGKYVEGN